MSIGKKFTQLTEETSFNGTELFAISKLKSGVWTSLRATFANLITYIQSEIADSWTSATYAASSDNWVSLGASATYRAVRVSYVVERSSLYQTGQFEVIHNGSSAKVAVIGKLNYSTAVDIEIKAARISGGQIQVNIKTGSVDGNNTTFQYRIADLKPI